MWRGPRRTNMIGNGVLRALMGKLRRKSQPPKSHRDHELDADAECYARALIAWLQAQQLPPEIEWSEFCRRSYVFAEETRVPPLTAMSLCKALSRVGVSKRWRYLDHHERKFREKRDLGQRRPRVLMVSIFS